MAVPRRGILPRHSRYMATSPIPMRLILTRQTLIRQSFTRLTLMRQGTQGNRSFTGIPLSQMILLRRKAQWHKRGHRQARLRARCPWQVWRKALAR